MARTATVVDRTRLVQAIEKAEAGGVFSTRNELYDAAAKLYGDEKVSPSVVYLRIKEWGLVCKTPIGKRGRKDLGAIKGAPRNRVPRAQKFKAPAKRAAIAALRHAVSGPIRYQDGSTNDTSKYLPVVNRVEAGSMKAAIKLKCLDCCAYDKEEIKHCACSSCPLFLFRPFQGKE